MNKRIKLTLLLLTVYASVIASSISVKNEDGIDIWYEFTGHNQTASVTCKGDLYFSYDNEYTGSIVIPAMVEHCGVEYKVTSIGNFAFYDCSSLTSVIIPDCVTSIGERAFRNCSSLTSVTIPESVTSIGNSAFDNCSSLISITIPESVTSIGDYTFYNCSSLKSVTIPEGVTSIGERAFYTCSSLISITIPESVTSIGDYTFYNCSSLTSINIPDGVTSIGYSAFEDCSSLTSVIIPDCVTSIGERAFRNCSSLKSVTIPEGVTSIGYSAFNGCSSLISITIPESVTSIGDYTFYNCSSLKSVTIPEGVTSIGERAFYTCSSLISITIPESVTSIGDYTFYNCSSLTSINIPDGVTSIGNSAFYGCYRLVEIYNKSVIRLVAGNVGNGYIAYYAKNVYTDESGESKLHKIDDYLFYVDGDNVELLAYVGDEIAITLPSDYEGMQYIIAKRAFEDYSSLTSVIIPDCVTSIGERAFRNCSSLKSVTIPEGVTSIGERAFEDCSSLKSVTIPEGVTSIGERAFYNCSSLKSVTILEGVTSIGECAFEDCSSLISITIPESVTSIGNSAFYGCYRLVEIYNKSVLRLVAGNSKNGYVAYYAKNVYTDQSGESKLHKIDDYVFYIDGDDIELFAYVGDETDITLPSDYEGMQYIIAKRAFSGLTSITSMNAVPPYVDSYAFNNLYHSIPIYVPIQSVEAYMGADNWRDFSNIIGLCTIELITENGTVTGAGIYEENSDVILTATPNEGYRFVKWSDGVEDSIRTITITNNMELTAVFIKQYTLNATAVNGTVTGVGVHDKGAVVTLTATPNEGYKFVNWSDGVEDSIRNITITEDVTLEAFFEIKAYSLNIVADNGTVEISGTVNIDGTYNHGEDVVLTATPNEGYRFVNWSDGVGDSIRTITITDNMELTAVFIKQYTLNATAVNGTVIGVGVHDEGAVVTLIATPNEGYRFVNWSDGVEDSIRIITITEEVTLEAFFEIKTYSLNVVADNGTVEITGMANMDGTYNHGTEITLAATANEGYRFVNWSDGVEDAQRTIIVTESIELEARFELDDTPVLEVDEDNISIQLLGNVLVVEGVNNYAVYTITGLYLGKVNILESGVYIVVADGVRKKITVK